MKKKPKQQRNFVAKAMRALCKPTVLTERLTKAYDSKHKHWIV